MPRWISYRFEKTSASCVIGTKPYLWAPVCSWRSLPQDLAHHLRRDRRRDAPARRLAARAPAMLDEDGHDDLRVVGGREPYEPRVRAAGLVLRGACLARHRDARDPGGLPCAALDDGDHERRLGQSGLRRHRSAPRLRVDGLHRVVVGVGDPVGPNVVLHDFWKLSASVPPHRSPPKFFSVFVVCGSLSSVSCGKFVWGVNCPVPSATAVVMTLNVEPGGYRSRYARGRSGLSGLARRSLS